MAGGEGAKERRRLKRLQDGGSNEGSTPVVSKAAGGQTPIKKSRLDSTMKKSFDQGKKKPFMASKGLSANHNNKKKTDVRRPSVPSQKKKDNKIKKPKHLKRKLEQTEEEDTRERVRQELEDYLTKKAQLSKQVTKTQLSKQDITKKMENTVGVKDQPLDFPRNLPPTSSAAVPSSSTPPKKKKPQRQVVEKDDDDDDDDEEHGDLDHSATAVNNKVRDSLFGKTEEETNSSADDSSAGSNEDPVPLVDEEEKEEVGDDSSSSDDEDDDEEESTGEPTVQRMRGRRRRGRKDTTTHIEETQKKIDDETPLMKKQKTDKKTDNEKKETSTTDSSDAKARYCLGRKPVTDFTIGEKYSGRVVYVKDFGVFFDIGCHSDAFCHVSRLRDDFVSNPHELFHEGDDDVQVRVVEIDRRQKRITVSLQSDERAADERASVEARAERKKIRQQKDAKKKNKPMKDTSTNDSTTVIGTSKTTNVPHVSVSPTAVEADYKPTRIQPSNPREDDSQMARKRLPDPSDPAEAKRQRKLARRAARREAMEES